jgi:hypothetical protein
MRMIATYTSQQAEQLKAAYLANDPVGFTEAAVGLRSAAVQAVESGYYSDGARSLQALSEALKAVIAQRPGDPTHGNHRTTQEFVSAVMPLFGINSTEVAANLGLSPEIDDYLIANKVDFNQLRNNYSLSIFLLHAMRLGLVDEFVTAFGDACGDLLSRQDAALAINKTSTADCFRYAEQSTLIMVFDKLARAGIPAVGITQAMDEKLALVLSRLCTGDAAHFNLHCLKGMQQAGMHLSLKAALQNTWSVSFNLDDIEFQCLTLDEAACFLGMNSRMQHGPNLIRHLVDHDPGSVRKAMHTMSHKKSVCTPKYLLRSCADFINSPAFKPENMAVIHVLMENAWEKIKKITDFQKAGKPFEVLRAHLKEAGIPNSIQQTFPLIRDNKGAILENELGM